GSGGCAGEQAPAGPDTHSCPRPWPFKKRRAHLPQGRGQLGKAHGWGGSSGDIPPSSGRRFGGGREDLGWCLGTKPVLSETASRRSRFVPRPTGGSPPAGNTAVRNKAGAAGVPSKRLDAGATAKDIPERTRGPMTPVCHR